MNVQSALNAYKETNLTEVEEASPHKLIELTFKDLNKNLLIIRRKLNENVKIGNIKSHLIYVYIYLSKNLVYLLLVA